MLKFVLPVVSPHVLEDVSEGTNLEFESDEESTHFSPTDARFRSLRDAITCLKDVHHFLEHKGHPCEATEAISLISSMTALLSVNLSKARQSSLILHRNFMKGNYGACCFALINGRNLVKIIFMCVGLLTPEMHLPQGVRFGKVPLYRA